MGWSQLTNQDSYLALKSDWDWQITPDLPANFSGYLATGLNNPHTQVQFGWTYSRMGYKGIPTSIGDFNNNKSIGAFRVSPTVYTYSFYYRKYTANTNFGLINTIDQTKVMNGTTPTAKPNSYLKKLGLYYNKPKTFKKDKVYQFNTTLINYLQIGGNPGSPNNPEKWRSPILYMVTPLGDESEILAEKPFQKLNNYESQFSDNNNKRSDTFMLPWPWFLDKYSLNTIENTTGRIFNIHYYSSPNEDVVSYFNERPTIFHSSVLFGNSHADTAYQSFINTTIRQWEYKENGKIRSFPPTVSSGGVGSGPYIVDGEGLVGHVVNETDWLIQGFSYVSLYTATFSIKPWTSGGNLFGNGWYVLQNSYVWYDNPKSTSVSVWQDQSSGTNTTVYTPVITGNFVVIYLLRDGDTVQNRKQTTIPEEVYVGCSGNTYRNKSTFGWEQDSGSLDTKLFTVGISYDNPFDSAGDNILLGTSSVNNNGRIIPPVGNYRITITSAVLDSKQGKLVNEVATSNSTLTLVSNTRSIDIKVYKNGQLIGTPFTAQYVSTPTDTFTPLGKLTIPTGTPDVFLFVQANGTDYFEIKYELSGELVAQNTLCSSFPAYPAVLDVDFLGGLSYNFEKITGGTNQSGNPYKFIANDPYYNMPVGGPWSGGPNIDVPNWVDYYGYLDTDTRTPLSDALGDGGGSGLFGYSKSPHEGFRTNNYIARYINQDKFNMSFKYQNDRGDNTGLKFYLSDTLPSQKPINIHKQSSGNVNIPINDLATITNAINVSSSGNEFLTNSKTLKEIKVTLNLRHTWDGDLVINLKGPRGKVINLFNREKGNSDNFLSTVFSSDDSQKSIYYGTPPFVGTFKMKKDIGVGYSSTGASTLNYRSNTRDIKELLSTTTYPGTVLGTWTLYVADLAGLDYGVLNSWSIEFIFDNTSNISYVGSLTQSVSEKSYNFYGLQGNQYIIFVADPVPQTTGSTYTVVKLNDLAIEDSYHPQNNTLVTVGTNSVVNSNYLNNNKLLFTPTGISGNYSYHANVGTGNTLNATQSLTYSVVHTRAGTGRFTSGIWENGNWINGWREDTKLYQFFDVQQFFSYNRDKKWRFTIIGPSYHTSQFNIGDKVSISNVVAIDINEERKLIKNYFTIINKTFNSLVVEFEFDFPIRRVQRDSDFHFINVTKNIWLNGNFFNGYFKGIWTNGLFYGYPFITEMYNSHWIDGVFKGGHFKSNPVSLTFKNLSTSGSNIVVNFLGTHSFNTGDSIYVNEFSDEKQTSVLFGDSIVNNVINNTSILTSLRSTDSGTWSSISLITGGYVKSNKNTALIQNINLDTLNVSSVTSNRSLDDRSVFSYNTWLDLVYDETSATNIFKPQTNINSLYPIGDANVYYSNNNLYGYTTFDLLSSDSRFRDSFSNVFRNYKLGTKYKIFHDYIGDSAYFDDYFTDTYTNPQEFKDLGWKYNRSIGSHTLNNPIIKFERTIETTDDSLINGKELRVIAQYDGGVLNLGDPAEEITDRYTEKIKQNRYTKIEFDLVSKNVQEDFYLGDYPGLGYIPLPMEQPPLHFGNLNLISRKIISPQTNTYINSLIYPTFLPIYKNINHTFTPNKKKSEYFYNKRDLMMTFRGSGSSGLEQSEYIIDNLKLYEIDMIPFFKYFTYENINRTVQIPIESKTQYKKPNYFTKIINLSYVSFNTSLSNQFNTSLTTQDAASQVNTTAIFNSSQPGSAQSS